MNKITAGVIIFAEGFLVFIWLFIFRLQFLEIIWAFTFTSFLMVWLFNNQLDKRLKIGKYREVEPK